MHCIPVRNLKRFIRAEIEGQVALEREKHEGSFWGVYLNISHVLDESLPDCLDFTTGHTSRNIYGRDEEFSFKRFLFFRFVFIFPNCV
ncbi:MAG: hypothetical protein RBG13Loki_0499 [Promethearchaeota archaeon CR_4]|nr:MAG: hypothetical protein RBG13Loki_0499 [Candidatus Lokiarchaeota archaeon CR_4]